MLRGISRPRDPMSASEFSGAFQRSKGSLGRILFYVGMLGSGFKDYHYGLLDPKIPY